MQNNDETAPSVALNGDEALAHIRTELAALEGQDAEEQFATLMHVSECFEELDRALTSGRATLPKDWRKGGG